MATQQTRRELLARGAGVGAAGAAVLVSAPPPSFASAHSGARTPQSRRGRPADLGQTRPLPSSELDRLQRLASIEQLLLFCYDAVLASRVSGPRMQRALQPLRAQEQAHVGALLQQLRVHGASVPEPPSSLSVANQHLAHRKVGGRLGQLRGAHDALRLLLSLEQVVVGAYFVALNQLADPQLVLLAAQIMANDAQHESMINLQLNPHDFPAGAPYGLVEGVH